MISLLQSEPVDCIDIQLCETLMTCLLCDSQSINQS